MIQRLLVPLLVAACLWSCVGAPKITTTQPVGDVLTGNVPVKVDLPVDVQVPIQDNRLGDYTSEFGVGPTLIVGGILGMVVWLSHRREMKRLSQNGGDAK